MTFARGSNDYIMPIIENDFEKFTKFNEALKTEIEGHIFYIIDYDRLHQVAKNYLNRNDIQFSNNEIEMLNKLSNFKEK